MKKNLQIERTVGEGKEPNIGISSERREGVIKILNSLLCDEYVLATKTKKYHWNVVAPNFNELHKFLGEQYEQLDETIDEVAERARSIGGKSFGTLSEFLGHTRLKEDPKQYPDAYQMLANLLDDHEAIIRNLRTDSDAADEKYHDMGTNDFLIGLIEKHEKNAWMLRSFLTGDSE